MAKFTRLLFLCLALSLPLSLASAQTYEITEAELSALETALTTAQVNLQVSRLELSTLKSDLIALQKESITLQSEFIQLSESFRVYALGEQKKRTMLIVSTSVAGALAVVFGIGLLF